MKSKLFIALIILALLFSGYLYKKFRMAPRLNLSTLQISDLAGNSIDINEIDADLIVLNFWATWCGPCRKELPILKELVGDFNEKNVVFVMVSDESLSLLNRFLQDKSYGMTFYKMDGALKDIDVYTIPTTYFLDKEKNVIKTNVNGLDWHSEELLSWMETFDKS